MDYTSIKVGQLPTEEISGGNFIAHEVAGILSKATFTDLAAFIGASDAVGFRAVSVQNGGTLPSTTTQEFILVGPGTYNNVGGGSTITVTEELNALVSNGTYWFIGVEIPIDAPPGNAVWGQIIGTLSNQTDLQNLFNLKADLVDGKVPSSQLPSYVDDVIEVANFAALPVTGETGKIYITIDTEYIYRWSGSAYIRIVDEAAAWGTITGTLSNQTDLQNALNTKATDSNVVHLTGSEVITGVKTFNANVAFTGPATFFDSPTGILLKQVGFSNYNKIQAIDGGFQFLENVGTSFFFNIQQSSIAFGLNTRRVTFNNSNLTSDRIYDLPNAGGTIALTYQLHDAVTIGTANGLSLLGQALSLALASNSATGALSSTDWNTFNGKQNALTNPITGTGTTNYIPKFTGSTALGNSLIYDNGTNVGIGTTSPNAKLTIFQNSGIDSQVAFGNTTDAQQVVVGKQGSTAYGATSAGDGFLYNFGSLSIMADYGGVIKFSAGGNAERMRITSGGNVGIGTTSPIEKLEVITSGAYTTIYTGANGNGASGLAFSSDNRANTWFSGSRRDSIGGLIGTDRFNILYNTNAILTATPSGNVGIGTTSPGQKLTLINGTFQIGGTSTFSDNIEIGRVGGDNNMAFATGGAERMRITSDGALLLGTYSQTNDKVLDLRTTYGLLSIVTSATNSAGTTINYSYANGSQGPLKFANAGGVVMTLQSGGSLNLTSLGTGLLYSNSGTLTSTNPSDSRLKDDITDLQYGLNEILQLRPVSYNWKNDTINQGKQFGFIAQEVQQVMPELVKEFTTIEDEEEVLRLGLDKEGIYAALVNAIKELKAEIEILKNK